MNYLQISEYFECIKSLLPEMVKKIISYSIVFASIGNKLQLRDNF